jgi:hypothetical protein
MDGGKGEFNIYYIQPSGEKKIIFSNNQELKSEEVVVGLKITEDNVEQIVQLVKL